MSDYNLVTIETKLVTKHADIHCINTSACEPCKSVFIIYKYFQKFNNPFLYLFNSSSILEYTRIHMYITHISVVQ